MNLWKALLKQRSGVISDAGSDIFSNLDNDGEFWQDITGGWTYTDEQNVVEQKEVIQDQMSTCSKYLLYVTVLTILQSRLSRSLNFPVLNISNNLWWSIADIELQYLHSTTEIVSEDFCSQTSQKIDNYDSLSTSLYGVLQANRFLLSFLSLVNVGLGRVTRFEKVFF